MKNQVPVSHNESNPIHTLPFTSYYVHTLHYTLLFHTLLFHTLLYHTIPCSNHI